MLVGKIDPFIFNHEDYLIQVKTVDGQQVLGVLKKGLWTWIKIHIGSLFGLFDRKSIQLSEVAKVALVQYPAEPILTSILDYKIDWWNKQHPKKEEIPFFNPDWNVVPLHANGKFHRWSDLNLEDRLIAEEIRDLLPPNLFFSVTVRKEADQDNRVSRVASLIFSKLDQPRRGREQFIPDFSNIAHHFLGLYPDVQKQFDRFRLKTTALDLIFREEDGLIRVKFNAR
jgi:hypothetical protein